MTEALDTVLRLVAEGRLTADEAAPLLDALDATGDGGTAPAAHASAGPGDAADDAASHRDGPSRDRAPNSLRIEIREGGRQTVNLRLPLAIGRFAVDRVPGLAGAHADRIREALRHGVRGPIVEVNEADGDGVRIVLE